MNNNMRQSNGRSRQRRSKNRTNIIVSLALGLFLMTVTVVILFFKLEACDRELSDLSVIEGKQARRLAELEPKVVSMELEIGALVESRLPYLLPLKFDKVFALNQDYAKNIVFSVAGKRGKDEKRHYEYKLVMDNQALTSVHPHIQIILFDRDGIQVGFSEFGIDKDGVPTLDILEHDETRSQIGEIDLTEETEPRYFTVKLKE